MRSEYNSLIELFILIDTFHNAKFLAMHILCAMVSYDAHNVFIEYESLMKRWLGYY